jgi:hypothetical protein
LERRRIFRTIVFAPNKKWRNIDFKDLDEYQVATIMETLPLYPLKKSLEILPLIKDSAV